jgi:hypothetical protein
MARFMDFHEDPKLPAEVIAQIAEDAIRRHHAAPGVPCGDVHQVDSLTWPRRTEQSRPGSKR